jgi:hypothetical protein
MSACSAIVDEIPMVIVKSGKPKVAAGYEVTGAQLSTYFIKYLDVTRPEGNGSDWWKDPAKQVDMCLYDGDFTVMTPVPTGYGSQATRVLVVISDGQPEFWALATSDDHLPVIDPATLTQ